MHAYGLSLKHGCRHDFEMGGGGLRYRMRAEFFDHTHQTVTVYTCVVYNFDDTLVFILRFKSVVIIEVPTPLVL
jgi:hypothetical protein